MFSKDQLKQLAPKLQKVEEDRLAQRYEYLGLLSEYQLYIKKPKQQLVYSKLNPKQHFLFKRILFDNMNLKNLRKAVKMSKRFYETEASGNVNLKTVKAIASTGVDRISVGSITHSATAVDFKLEI